MATGDWQTGLDTLVQGRVKEAIGQLRACVQQSPESFEGHYFLGTALNQVGRYREAVDSLQRAASLNPKHGQAHYQLGLAYNGVQEPDLAIKQFQTAVQLEPGHEPSQSALAQLQAAQAQAAAFNVAAPVTVGETVGENNETTAAPAPARPAVVLPSALNLPFETDTPQPPKYIRSLLFGLAAGLLGALLWEMICIAIHEHVDGMGILLGGLVGWAVAEGSDTRGRTPIGVQMLAIFLTAIAFGVGEAFNTTGYAIVYGAMAGVALNIPATLIASLLALPFFFLSNLGSLGLMALTCCWGWLQASRIWR